MKKLCTLLALVLLLSCIPMAGCTTEPKPNPATDFEYQVRDDGGIEITKYIGESDQVIIPQTIDSKDVTAIGEHAFAGMNIVSLVMPDTVIYIYPCAFQNCEYLATIKMSSSLVAIGLNSFRNCTSLTDIDLSMNSLNTIDHEAFYDCKNLKTVQFGDNITRIRDEAFRGCESLEEIILPKNLMELGEYTFFHCDGAKKIWIPKTLEDWGSSAFHAVPSVKEIIFEDGLKKICTGDILCSQGQLETVRIPASVEYISSAAFSDCIKLKEIYFDGPAPQIGQGNLYTFVTPKENVKIYYDPSMPGWDTTPLRDIYTLVPIE